MTAKATTITENPTNTTNSDANTKLKHNNNYMARDLREVTSWSYLNKQTKTKRCGGVASAFLNINLTKYYK
jgi:hypothetical protein